MIDINIKTQIITIINELVQTISYIKKNKHSRIQMCCMSCNVFKTSSAIIFLIFRSVHVPSQKRLQWLLSVIHFKRLSSFGEICVQLRSLTSEIHWPHFPDLGWLRLWHVVDSCLVCHCLVNLVDFYLLYGPKEM